MGSLAVLEAALVDPFCKMFVRVVFKEKIMCISSLLKSYQLLDEDVWIIILGMCHNIRDIIVFGTHLKIYKPLINCINK
jgi:hypothetical protein